MLGRAVRRRIAPLFSRPSNKLRQQPGKEFDPYALTIRCWRERLYGAESLAWRHYVPKFYPGKINFVQATINPYYPKNPIAVWGHLAKEMGVEKVHGDHNSLVESKAPEVAKILSVQLRPVLRRLSTRTKPI
jgi:hypothetical protein